MLIELKSFDGTIVSVPIEKKEEFENNQKMIKQLLNKGSTLEEIYKLMKEDNF